MGSAKGSSNPYARPVSAKDIVSDLQNQQKIKKTPSASQMPSSASQYNSGSPGTPMFGFPVNAFMRPQSAFKKVESPTPPKNQNSPTKVTTAASSPVKTSVGPKSSPRKTVPPTRLEREPDLSLVQKHEYSVQNGNQSNIRNQFGPASKTSPVNKAVEQGTGENVVSSPTKVAASSQTLKSEVAKQSEAHSNGISKTTSCESSPSKAVGYAKPVSSLPRPGSAVSTRSATPDSGSQVRNLNYTPTRPYHEVSNPSPTNASNASKPPISATTKTQQTSETSITVKTEPPKGTTYMAPSNISKTQTDVKSGIGSGVSNASSSSSSKQSSILSGTTYYRKESKGDIMIHEQRPQAIGAPSLPPKLPEKGLTNQTSGSELGDGEDDESEIPSG